MQQDKFKEVLKDVSDLCKFEMWLRFYFIQKKEKELVLNIPEDIIEGIKEEYPLLGGLAERLNNDTMTPEKSQNALLNYIGDKLEGKKHDSSSIPIVLDSKNFEAEMNAFHMWVNAHGKDLDKKVLEFKEWMQLFEAWKRTEKGQQVLSHLNTSSWEANP